MEANDVPPILSEAGKPAEPVSPPKAAWRWWVHVVVLAMFPLIIGALSLMAGNQTGSLMPSTTVGLLYLCVEGALFFGVFFLIAWLVARPNSSQLLFKWRGGGMPFVWGMIYSIGLRVIVAVPMVIWVVLNGAKNFRAEDVQEKVEHLADPKALTGNPVYFVLALTLVSFIVGGLREELWRAAMFAGIKELFPRGFARIGGKAAAIVVVAVLFGCGHVSQGGLAAFSIGLLGAGLGVIMLWHRSIWEATIAHGIFDASTFALIWLLAKFPQMLHPN